MVLEHSTNEKTLREALLVDLSRHLASAIGAQPFQCATNAWRTLIEYPDLFRTGGQLIEGWFVIETDARVVMNEHVWCELDGRIVDPSILLLVPATTPVFYFPGLSRDYAEVEALEGELFPHVRFDGMHGEDGLGHPGYRAAREAARRKVYALATRSQPPKAMQFLTAQDQDGVLPPGAEEAEGLLMEGEPLNISLSLTTARYLPAQPERCWYNAREALLRMPHEFFRAWYVEGWRIGQWADTLCVTEHGWIETPHAGLVDPTIVLDGVPKRLAYVPGLRLSWTELQAYTRAPLPLARHLFVGMEGRAERQERYQEACHLAFARGEALAWQTGLPLAPQPGKVTTVRGVGKTLLTVEETSWDFPVPSTPSARVVRLLHDMAEAIRQEEISPLSLERSTWMQRSPLSLSHHAPDPLPLASRLAALIEEPPPQDAACQAAQNEEGLSW